MKIDLDKIVLGHSPLTDSIFAGVIQKPGVWRHKVNVTDQFLGCIIDRFAGKQETLECNDGKLYEITVREIKR